MGRIIIVGIALLLDWLIGDPQWLPHPIRGIGWLIKNMEKKLQNLSINLYLQGVLLWLSVVGSTFLLSWFGLKFLAALHPLLANIGEIILIYTCLAAKCLDSEAQKVRRALMTGELTNARKLLGYLVGRQTDQLSRAEVIRGAIETVAENTSDGVIAPLCFAFLGGAPLALIYKAVNTLDSMVGYKNEKYKEMGWASARLDDLFNLLPARLTACCLPLAALLINGNFRNSWKIMWRDRRKHASPNAGYPEAAVAGALKIQLGGTNIYFGQRVEKPKIGDPLIPLDHEQISQTISLMYLTEIMVFFLGVVIFFLHSGFDLDNLFNL